MKPFAPVQCRGVVMRSSAAERATLYAELSAAAFLAGRGQLCDDAPDAVHAPVDIAPRQLQQAPDARHRRPRHLVSHCGVLHGALVFLRNFHSRCRYRSRGGPRCVFKRRQRPIRGRDRARCRLFYSRRFAENEVVNSVYRVL